MKQDEEIFSLPLSEEEKLSSTLFDYIYSFQSDTLPDDWVHTTIAMPNSFFPIFKSTLEAYRKLLDTQKTFPAIEAIIMEARNSLPQEYLDTNPVESV